MPPRFTPIVEIAPGSNLTGASSGWSWTDLTMQGYVHEPSGITIRRGRGSRNDSATPDTCNVTLLNDAGRFVPRNPLGPWYGTLKRGTPLRVLVQPQINSAADAFGRTVSGGWGTADSGGSWTVVGTAGDYAVSTTNGGRMTNATAGVQHIAVLSASVLRVDLKAKVRVGALSTGAAQSAGLILRYADSSNYVRGVVEFNTDQSMTARIVSRASGTDTLGTGVSTGLTHSASTWYWIRVQTGLNSIRMKVWTDGTSEPATWTLDGSTTVLSNLTAGKFGAFSRRETGNTNSSANTDFDNFSMADGPRIQFTGFVDEWPIRWNDAGLAQAFAPITASGQLQRLSRAQPLASAINRACTSGANSSTSTVVGYWPMEDGRTSTTFASGLTGGTAQGYSGSISLGSDSDLVGSDALPVFSGNGSVRFVIPPYAASTTWAVRWLMKIPASSVSGTAQIMSWVVPGGSPIVRWQLTLTPGSPDTVTLSGWNWSGATVFTGTTVNFVDSSSSAELSDGRQLYFEVDGVQSGANINVTWQCWFMADDGTGAKGVGVGESTAATNANVTLVYHDAVTGFGGGGHTIGHVLLATDTSAGAGANGVTDRAGEGTDVRLQVVLEDLNIINVFGDLTHGSGSTSQAMGPMGSDDIVAELQEIEATEIGTLFDGKQAFVHILPRSMKQDRPIDLTLDASLGQVGWPLEPTDDGYLLVNDVEVTNVGGSSAKAKDRTSIAAQGVRSQPTTVNTYRDADLQYQADWRLAVGTNEDLRYPAIVLNLTRHHLTLASSWCDADIGSRIQITNIPSAELPPDTIDLVIDGYTEFLSASEWVATLNCSPSGPWLVGVWDEGKRWDCGASTTSGSLTTTATSVPLTIADTCTWSHASDFDIMIGGERMTVTAVSAAVGSGASWTQTLTVTRSVNGIVKTHSSGAAVHLADPFRWGV